MPDPKTVLPCVRKRLHTDFPLKNVPDTLDGPVLATLRQSLFAVFDIATPSRLLIYPARPKDNDMLNLGSGFFGSLGFSSLGAAPAPRPAPCQDPPVIVNQSHGIATKETNVGWVETNWSFGGIVMDLGGVSTLLLLLGRVVELRLDDQEVAAALDILLSTAGSSHDVHKEFLCMDGFVLLGRILRSELCQAGIKTLQVMVKHCVSTPYLLFDEKRRIYFFNEQTSQGSPALHCE